MNNPNTNTHLFHVMAVKSIDNRTLTLSVPGGTVTLNFDSRSKMRHVAAVIIDATPKEKDPEEDVTKFCS